MIRIKADGDPGHGVFQGEDVRDNAQQAFSTEQTENTIDARVYGREVLDVSVMPLHYITGKPGMEISVTVKGNAAGEKRQDGVEKNTTVIVRLEGFIMQSGIGVGYTDEACPYKEARNDE